MSAKASMVAVATATAVGLVIAGHAPTVPDSEPALAEGFDRAFAFDESTVDFASLRGQADAAIKALIEKRADRQAS